MRLLTLLALLAAGAWFAPQLAESANGPCPALELRVAALLKADGGTLPPGLLDAVQGMARASGGALAQAYASDRFPQLPPDLGCVAAWWKLAIDRNAGGMARAP